MNRYLNSEACSRLVLLTWVLSYSLTSSTSVAEEGALQNKRLFFSHSERVEAAVDSAEVQAVLTEPVLPVAEPINNAIEPRVTEIVVQPVKIVGIRFTAIVSGAAEIIVLINGAPCLSLPHLSLEDQGAHQVLNCPQLDNPKIALSWASTKQQLVVKHTELKTVRLAVGEGV